MRAHKVGSSHAVIDKPGNTANTSDQTPASERLCPCA